MLAGGQDVVVAGGVDAFEVVDSVVACSELVGTLAAVVAAVGESCAVVVEFVVLIGDIELAVRSFAYVEVEFVDVALPCPRYG